MQADELSEFSQDFHNEIWAEAHALEALREEIFVQKVGAILEEYGEIEIDKRKIGFVHKKSDIPNFQTPYTKYHIPNTIFYGHSHKPWIEEIKGVTYANPGNLAGIHYDPTFAVYETSSKKIKLIILNQI